MNEAEAFRVAIQWIISKLDEQKLVVARLEGAREKYPHIFKRERDILNKIEIMLSEIRYHKFENSDIRLFQNLILEDIANISGEIVEKEEQVKNLKDMLKVLA